MKNFPRLILRCSFEIVEVCGEVSAVATGEEKDSFNGMIVLKNETTRFMFEKLQEGITLPELIKACLERYTDSTVDEVGPKVVSFLDQLREKGLLVADPDHGIRVDD